MKPIYELYAYSTQKDTLDKRVCDITRSRILLDNLLWVELYEWQQDMLDRIVNMGKQIKSESGCCFTNHEVHDYCEYNMLYMQGSVFLMNMTTGKLRIIKYETN